MSRLSLVTSPANPALDWDTEVKGHLRLYSDEEKAYATSVLIPAVTRWAESYLGRALITQTYDLFMDDWPWDGVVRFPKPPLQAIQFVHYYDQRQVSQTWAPANYVLDAPQGPAARPARLRPVFGTFFPVTLAPMNAIQIRFDCGYGTTFASVPATIKAAMLLELAHMFENRESDPLRDGQRPSERLLSPFRIRKFDS